MNLHYLESARRQFILYKGLGEKAIAQIEDNILSWQPNEDSNTIVTIVKHMWGNMLSRWTDFLTTDGEKSWRQRDAEFENDNMSREQLMKKWEEGWQCIFKALDGLNEDDLGKTIYIRNEPHTVLEAINRQIAHYAYHVGQIVYIAKLKSTEEWKSLSIPRKKA
jgi:hypothetical protein